jgi:hypothetical protein
LVARVLAVVAPVLGVGAVVLGLVQVTGGEAIGYLYLFLGADALLLGYFFIRIVRIARRLPR